MESFGQLWAIWESKCFYWLFYTATADWLFKQVTCLTLYNWPLVPAWTELRRTSLLHCNFPLQPFRLSVNLLCKLALKEKVTTIKVKWEPGQKTGEQRVQRSCSFRNFMLHLVDFQTLPTPTLMLCFFLYQVQQNMQFITKMPVISKYRERVNLGEVF